MKNHRCRSACPPTKNSKDDLTERSSFLFVKASFISWMKVSTSTIESVKSVFRGKRTTTKKLQKPAIDPVDEDQIRHKSGAITSAYEFNKELGK